MQQIDLTYSDKYCVFRSGDDRFCLPAPSIRNVGPRPVLCRLPMTDDVLAGLAHEQREFIPVYSFRVIRGVVSLPQQEQQILVLTADSGAWGLLIDEVHGLESLELSLNSNRGQSGTWSSICVGSTAFMDQVVTAIDSQDLLEFVQEQLHQSWNHARQQAIELTQSNRTEPGYVGHAGQSKVL